MAVFLRAEYLWANTYIDIYGYVCIASTVLYKAAQLNTVR